MIKLESVHIEEMRGIRKLDLEFKRKTFAISGQNGSGKSGVIDAIEFGLTGDIGRLAGRGTKGLSVADHGPHVDKTKFPDAAFVKLKLFFPELNKSATITRKINDPKNPVIDPPDADIQRVLNEVASHPEITLTRRDVIRFILVEPTKRSEEIQALLKLEEIGQARAALNTAHNRLSQTERAATAQIGISLQAVRLHLQSHDTSIKAMLDAINKRRDVLGLKTLASLDNATKVDEGIADGVKAGAFNKASALRDLNALSEAVTVPLNKVRDALNQVRAELAGLERDPTPPVCAAAQRSD